MLENGLGIYMVKLQVSSTKCTAALAGPHHSFNFLAGKVGNVSYLLKKFKDGIEYWRTSGPPAPKSIGLSDEELALAAFVNKAEVANYGIADLEDEEDIDEKDSTVCLPHHSLKAGSYELEDLQTPWKKPIPNEVEDPPPAPKKVTDGRTRLPTETRNDLLEEDSSEPDVTVDVPCG